MTNNVQQIITKKVTLAPNWIDNDHEGFKQYLQDVYDTNTAISDLFEDKNLQVDTMTVTMEVFLSLKDPTIVSVEEAPIPTIHSEVVSEVVAVDTPTPPIPVGVVDSVLVPDGTPINPIDSIVGDIVQA